MMREIPNTFHEKFSGEVLDEFVRRTGDTLSNHDIVVLEGIRFTFDDERLAICNTCGTQTFGYRFIIPPVGVVEEYVGQRDYCNTCVRNVVVSRLKRDEYEMYEYISLNYIVNSLIDTEEEHLKDTGIVPFKCVCTGIGYMNFDSPVRGVMAHTCEGAEQVIVHANCATVCHTCEEVYVDSKYFRRGVRMDRIDGEIMCPSCVDKHFEGQDTTNCNQCGLRILENDYNYSSVRDNYYCESCYAYPVYCSDCDESYNERDGHFDCAWEYGSDYIRSYSYKPRARFFGNSTYFIGFELEVESRDTEYDDDDDNDSSVPSEGANIVHRYLGNRAYYKEDGSLDNGFEIVTHPHTLEELQRNVNWGFLTDLRDEGFRSWNTDTCGLHVHISKVGFTAVRGDRTAHEARFLKFIYDNQPQVERIAGRESNTYATFADKGKVMRKIKHNAQADGRYSVVNTEPRDTYEVRIFRGSLRKERVLSALEFTVAVMEFTRTMKVVAKHHPFAWSHFVAYVVNNQEKYPNLLTIINESFANSRILERTN